MNDEEIMKRCQRGFGNYKNSLDDANNLLAECYGAIGKLQNELEQFNNNKNWTRPYNCRGELINEHALYRPKLKGAK